MAPTAPAVIEGKHRKVIPSQTKGRIALVVLATSTVSTAGIGGAAAATLQEHSKTHTSSDVAAEEITPVATTDALPQSGPEAAPQILALPEYKPVNNIQEQLSSVVEHNTQQAEARQAAQAPTVARPAEGTFTSGFGMRWGSLHAGLDIANVEGTPILAAMAGTVIDSGPASGFGQWIRIQHDDGSIAVYGHMETLDVAVGERVTAGQKIAGMGNRGFSTGSHLHFELYPTGSEPVDPAPWFAEHGITF